MQIYILVLLQLSFILIALFLLHSLKQIIGQAAYYLSLGGILVFTQFAMPLGISINSFSDSAIAIGPIVFIMPVLSLMLVTYIVDKTLETQRFIWGVAFLVGLFFYLSFITETQLLIPGYKMDLTVDGIINSELFSRSRTYILAIVLSILINFLVLPVIYEIMRLRNIGISISVTVALCATQIIDVFFFQLVIYPHVPNWLVVLGSAYLTRLIAMIWVSLLTIGYLKLRNARKIHENSSRKPFDILISFIGSHGHNQKLQANIREWEGRYQMVVENTNDLIFMISEKGGLLDCNGVVIDKSQYKLEDVLKLNIDNLMTHGPVWAKVWDNVYKRVSTKRFETLSAIYSCEYIMTSRNGERIMLEAVITPLFIQQNFAALVVARDITHRKQLEMELVSKQNQLVHSQRLEAVGKLAGGIAHDFNNLLHAMQGSLDQLQHNLSKDKDNQQLVNTVLKATERAANLTNQMLGFARGGKYQVKKIKVSNIIEETAELFNPVSGKSIKLKVALHPDAMIIEGDPTQLQQAFSRRHHLQRQFEQYQVQEATYISLL